MNIRPKPVIINSKHGVSVKLRWDPRFVRSLDRTFGSGNELQEYADETMWESMKPYVPHATGIMEQVSTSHTTPQFGSGELTWVGPYARYLYYGMVMVDPKYRVDAFRNSVTGRVWSRKGIKKIATTTPLKFQGGGKRGSRWAERWMDDNLHEFQKDLQRRAGEMLRQ